MITELRVRDLATIADVTLQFGAGLNVLTGETGAGKSMLVDALSLLLGERGDSQLVRPGAARAVVEGAFEVADPAAERGITDLGLDLDEHRVVIRREVSAEGRSRAWINGSPTTVGVLQQVGALLVDLHGQHETQSLLHPATQRDLLDALGDAAAERQAVAEAHRDAAALMQEEAALLGRRDDVRRRADYLRHVVQEIDQARVQHGEDEELQAEARRLTHAGLLGENARMLAELVGGDDASALVALGRAEKPLAALERTDPATGAWRELLDAAYANLTELARVAGEYAGQIQEDPGRLADIERRRDLLFRLRQKYGETLDAVRMARVNAAAELEVLDTAEFDLKTLAARRVAAEGALQAAAAALTGKRRAAASRLARGVNRLLPKLGMPGGKVRAELATLDAPGPAGRESVSFMVQLNLGLDERPLAKSASGGELSRLMLALKVVLASHDAVETMVFDEVDQGIGGEVGRQVGDALATVAGRRQVLVITHLPQIAARADRHLVVSKEARGGIATSDVGVVHGEDRVVELARMLGDSGSPEARRHAQAMLRR